MDYWRGPPWPTHDLLHGAIVLNSTSRESLEPVEELLRGIC